MDIVEIIPEIKMIEDESLKEKTIKVWEEAIKIGGWSYEDLDKIPFTLLIPDTDCSLIEHTRAVTQTSIAIAETFKKFYKFEINMDYLITGAILHDVGKLLEYKREGEKFTKSTTGERIRHPVSGAYLAFKYGLPEEVIHIISAHSKEGNFVKRTVEAIIVNHADFVNFEPLKGEAYHG